MHARKQTKVVLVGVCQLQVMKRENCSGFAQNWRDPTWRTFLVHYQSIFRQYWFTLWCIKYLETHRDGFGLEAYGSGWGRACLWVYWWLAAEWSAWCFQLQWMSSNMMLTLHANGGDWITGLVASIYIEWFIKQSLLWHMGLLDGCGAPKEYCLCRINFWKCPTWSAINNCKNGCCLCS